MDMTSAFREVGSYRGAAQICGTTHRTVKKAVLAAQRAEAGLEEPVVHNYDAVRDVVAERVERTKAKISAKRLLPVVRAAGYEGSARNLRRLVAEVKSQWRMQNHRGRRPGVWTPGDMVVFDWGEIGPLFVFCAVVAWSRVRFVSFADNLGADATMTALAECFEYIGGVPKTALTDRMGCLKGGTVAGLVIPTPAYVRFCAHYRIQPDFCEGADPESKGLVENLVGYVKSDLMIPQELVVTDLATANAKRWLWLDEVNRVEHSEICAIPNERLVVERELFSPLPTLRAAIGKIVVRKVSTLSCVRFGSARYSVPTSHIGRQVELRVRDGVITILMADDVIAEHLVVSPGETSVHDDHYGGPRHLPTRAVRPKSVAEKAFCDLGPAAEAFIKGAAAQGMTGLARDLIDLCQLETIHGREPVIAALERAVAFSRFRAADVVSILGAGHGAPRPTPTGERPSSSNCRRSPCVHCRTTPSAKSHDHDPTAVGARHGGGTAPAQALGHAHAQPGAASHSQDPALEARGVPAHPDRGRDRVPGPLERPSPDEGGGLPGPQDLGGVRRGRQFRRTPDLRLPVQPGMGPGQGESVPRRAGRLWLTLHSPFIGVFQTVQARWRSHRYAGLSCVHG